jgi:hypothetical protein
MSDTESNEAVIRAIADDAVVLIDERVGEPRDSMTEALAIGGAALARLARLLQAQLGATSRDHEVLALCAHAVIETWLTGHAMVLLGEPAVDLVAGRSTGTLTLEDLARRLDDEMYGASDGPKAFRRHLRSFFDEIDLDGCEGTPRWLARYRDDGRTTRVQTSPTPRDEPIDFIRVCLWVTLFLSHYYFAAVGDDATAKEARALFDRLRAATDDFYQSRRRAAR